MVVIRGRLTPEIGAVVQRALDAAADRLFEESRHAPDGDRIVDDVTPAQRRADALARMAECALAAGLDRGTAAALRPSNCAEDRAEPAGGRATLRGGDRYLVVLHVEPATLQADASSPAAEVGQAALEVGTTAVGVSAETAQRIACDAALVVMRHGADGTLLDVGRKTRTIPAALRRALAARDGTCTFPGCTAPARYCDAHHLRHWAHGGDTSLRNTTLLCRAHHHQVHAGGFAVVRDPDGAVRFFRPDGRPIELAPAPPRWSTGDARAHDPTVARLAGAGVTIGACAGQRSWAGEPFDVGWVIDVLRGASPSATRIG